MLAAQKTFSKLGSKINPLFTSSDIILSRNSSSKMVKFLNNKNLPSLPVPKLKDTINKYIKTVQPFLTQRELENTKNILREFEKNDGAVLQTFLENRAQKTENWLSEWWDNIAYLEYRDPVVVYSSPGLIFPLQKFSCEEERLKYAAKLILGAVDYKLLIDRDGIPSDKMGKDPLDMNQYKKIFGTCRVPASPRDQIQFNQNSKHIVVAINNNFFKLNVVTEDNKLPSLNYIIEQLRFIIKNSENSGVPIGILSSDNRDNWSKAYNILIQDETNKSSVETIQSALFLLCLDKPLPKWDSNILSMAEKQCITGGGSTGNSANRWFDKTVQFIVGTDGVVGLTYEHSPAEGQPIAVMTDYVVNYINGNKSTLSSSVVNNQLPTILPFNSSVELNAAITTASTNIDKLSNNLELNVFKFDKFGKEFAKSQKLSPDSFIQIAMQYAFYRYHKVPAAHYESAATRKYIHGRTETIRSCSNESIKFATTMLDKSADDKAKLNALKNAISSHKNYTIEALNGFGVDRHLLGLKLAAKELAKDIPELYKDISFTRSAHMRLSTSQVATKCEAVMGYGPLVHNGYGCCYNPRANDIYFAVSCFVDNPETNTEIFRKALEESLMDMHSLLARNQQSKL